jgi:hypothetical protein
MLQGTHRMSDDRVSIPQDSGTEASMLLAQTLQASKKYREAIQHYLAAAEKAKFPADMGMFRADSGCSPADSGPSRGDS